MSRLRMTETRRQRLRLAVERNIERMETETRSLPPVTCQCGRGPVVTLFGCQPCDTEHGTRYERELLSTPVRELLRRG